MQAWLSAFVFTQLVEIPIYRRGLRCSYLAAFGASALTHPLVWFGFFHPDLPLSYVTRAIAAELFAWLGEAAFFYRYGKRALLWSFIANAASVLLGLLSRAWLGVP